MRLQVLFVTILLQLVSSMSSANRELSYDSKLELARRSYQLQIGLDCSRGNNIDIYFRIFNTGDSAILFGKDQLQTAPMMKNVFSFYPDTKGNIDRRTQAPYQGITDVISGSPPQSESFFSLASTEELHVRNQVSNHYQLSLNTSYIVATSITFRISGLDWHYQRMIEFDIPKKCSNNKNILWVAHKVIGDFTYE